MSDLTPQPLAFIDTETNGLRSPWKPGGRRVWEVAVVRRDPDGSERSFWSVISDIDLRDSDEFALKIGKFDDRWKAGSGGIVGGTREIPLLAQPEALAMEKVIALTRDCHLWGSNPAFDMENIEAAAYRLGLRPPSWHYHPNDISSAGLGFLTHEMAVDRFRWKSDVIAEQIGVKAPGEFRHTAMGDVRWAMDWYDLMFPGVFPQK